MRRLKRRVTIEGVGVHTGAHARVHLHPAQWQTGRIVRLGGGEAAVHVRHASAPGGCTMLEVGARRLATPEHLLAALVGLGVTDVCIEVDGAEMPILDGSAAPWCAAVMAAGLEQGPPDAPLDVEAPVHVVAHGGEAWLRPAPTCRVSVEVAWPGLSGVASTELGDDFVTEVAPARTFVFAEQVEHLRAAGRGRGASHANTVVWGETQHLRFPDEPVRHKLLDAVGDLALAGGPIRGHLHVVRGSHALHQAVLRAWLEDS